MDSKIVFTSVLINVKKLTLPVFILSTIFMIVFSVKAITSWPNPWNQLSITIACLLPLFIILTGGASKWFLKNNCRVETQCCLLIILLGILNVIFGEHRNENFKGMGLFLLSGLCVFSTAKFILKSYKAQVLLFWLYTFGLVILAIHSLYSHLWLNQVRMLVSDNPIPESAIITLFFSGPLFLISRKKTSKGKVTLICCLLLGATSIFATQERGAILCLLVMIALLCFLFIKRFWLYFLCIILSGCVLSNIFYETRKDLPQNVQQLIAKLKSPPIYRMEMYFFSYHVITKNPFWGTGLWAPLSNHLSDYNEQISAFSGDNKEKFYSFVENENENNTSFHNMLLCMFVQMGSIFTITYLLLMYYIFRTAFQNYKQSPETYLTFKLLATLFFGFFIQSMFVDALMYPNINFIFHSILGAMSNSNLNHSSDLKSWH
jgi:hypothetical protein